MAGTGARPGTRPPSPLPRPRRSNRTGAPAPSAPSPPDPCSGKKAAGSNGRNGDKRRQNYSIVQSIFKKNKQGCQGLKDKIRKMFFSIGSGSLKLERHLTALGWSASGAAFV